MAETEKLQITTTITYPELTRVVRFMEAMSDDADEWMGNEADGQVLERLTWRFITESRDSAQKVLTIHREEAV